MYRHRAAKSIKRANWLKRVRANGGPDLSAGATFQIRNPFSPDSEAMGFLLQIIVSCPCALSRQVAGAGCRCRCWCWCCELAVLVPSAGAGELAVDAVETGWWRCCRVPVLVLGARRRCWCWCCELAVHVVETGCWCWCRAGAGAVRASGGDRLLVPVLPGAGAGAGAVSWLCTWRRQVAGAGAGRWRWWWVLCRCWCWCCELAVHVADSFPGAGAGRWRWWVVGAGSGAGAVSWLCTWWRHVAGAGAGWRCWCWCRVPLLVLVLGAGCRCW